VLFTKEFNPFQLEKIPFMPSSVSFFILTFSYHHADSLSLSLSLSLSIRQRLGFFMDVWKFSFPKARIFYHLAQIWRCTKQILAMSPSSTRQFSGALIIKQLLPYNNNTSLIANLFSLCPNGMGTTLILSFCTSFKLQCL
jgi:hypothetical protein